MTINTDFPFAHCESCTECVLRVNTDSAIYADDGIVTRVITVSCENAALCRRLEEMRNGKEDSSRNGN